jgi:hypothetical protein
MWVVSKWVRYSVDMVLSDVGSEQVGDIALLRSVVMWVVSKWGDLFWVWSVVMWAASKAGDIAWVLIIVMWGVS